VARKSTWNAWQRPSHGCWTSSPEFLPLSLALGHTKAENVCQSWSSWGTGSSMLWPMMRPRRLWSRDWSKSTAKSELTWRSQLDSWVSEWLVNAAQHARLFLIWRRGNSKSNPLELLSKCGQMRCRSPWASDYLGTFAWFLTIDSLCTDVITIEKTGEFFRLIYDTKGRFTVHRITKEEAAVSNRFPSCQWNHTRFSIT